MRKTSLIINVIFFLIFFFSGNNGFAQNQFAISKDGVQICYHVEGEGELALVFVHGWSCDKSIWESQVKEFSAKYKVVTIDLAGHGESGAGREKYTMELFGEDIASVVNKIRLKKIILLGHSMGGPVVLEAARILKDKVVGLVGADTFQNLGITLSSDQVEPFLKPFREKFITATKLFVKEMFPANADTMLVKRISEKMSSANPTMALSAMQNMFADNGITALKELAVPLISINCDRYPILEESNRKLVKKYEIKKMYGVGHFVMLEDSRTFNKLLQEAIDELKY